MKPRLTGWWLAKCSIVFCCLASLSRVTGCTGGAEARIRHYFGVAPNQPLQETTIRAALVSQFPVGTPSTVVETSLAARGIGKDGKSMMWRPQADQWRTNKTLCCQPFDYTDGLISKRRITVCFDLDEKQKVKQIEVESFDYSL